MNSTLLGCGGGGVRATLSCVHFHGRHNRLYVRWNLNLTFEASGLKQTPHISATSVPPRFPPRAPAASPTVLLSASHPSLKTTGCSLVIGGTMLLWCFDQWSGISRNAVLSPSPLSSACTNAHRRREAACWAGIYKTAPQPTPQHWIQHTFLFCDEYKWTECSPSSQHRTPNKIIVNLKFENCCWVWQKDILQPVEQIRISKSRWKETDGSWDVHWVSLCWFVSMGFCSPLMWSF